MIGVWLLCAAAAAIDLDDARARATERAIGVERARAEADAAAGDAGAWVGRALPAVTASGSVNAGGGQTAFGFDRPTFVLFGAGIGARWTLIDPGGWAAAASARRTARGSEALLAWSRVRARRDATVAIAEALAAGDVAAALRLAADDAATSSDAVAQRVRAGLRPPADGASARAEALAVAALAIEAEARVAATCAALQGLLDLDITGSCEVDAVDAWEQPAEATDTHPALRASEEALGAARSARSAAILGHAPTVTATGDITEYLGSGTGWSAAATLDVPLTGATAGPGEARAAGARVRLAEAELDEQERALAVARVSAERTLKAALAGLEARLGALEAAEEAWRQVDGRYQAELAPIADWLTARRGLQDARVGLARARAAVGIALAEVEAARGIGG